MRKKGRKLVTKCLRMCPRDIFNMHEDRKLFVKEFDALEHSGVYVLYRDDQPYYVGKAKNIAKRLHDHANKFTDRYFPFWNYFSVFFAPEPLYGEIERVLIAAMPTANSSEPSIPWMTLPKKFRSALKNQRSINL